MKNIFLIIFFIFISTLISCATTPNQTLSPAVYYKNDICFWHLGEKFCGVGVIPESEEMYLTLDTHNDIRTLMMTTCHREVDTNDPDKGLRRKNGIVTVEITPTLEKGRACPYYFAAFNDKGKHAWGTIAIKSDKYSLKAIHECNGKTLDVEGVSICQSKEGLIERITFEEDVLITKPINGPAEREEDCPVLNVNGNVVEYVNPNRECLYGFIGKSSKKMFQLYTIGYEEIVVR